VVPILFHVPVGFDNLFETKHPVNVYFPRVSIQVNQKSL